MSNWKDEDIATPELIKEYLEEFKAGIESNEQFVLQEEEKTRVEESLEATEKFCQGLLEKKNKLYMHDIVLMAIGFYGGSLTALDCREIPSSEA